MQNNLGQSFLNNSHKAILIGHRGACAFRPEHTIGSFQEALRRGTDYLEPDLVVTRDGHLIVRHENEISTTTNVAFMPEFADRKTVKIIDGVQREGWFTEDFLLSEIKTMRARERIKELRPSSAKWDDCFEILTFQEVIDFAKQNLTLSGARVGLYPETKHPSYFKNIGLPMEEKLIEQLERNGLNDADSPVFIQSFEVENLKQLRLMTSLPLVQLIDHKGLRPFDFVLAGPSEGRSYDDLLTPNGLKEVATYANVIAPSKEWVIARDSNNLMLEPTSLVLDAHAVGLKVHIWTLRPENFFLPDDLKALPTSDDLLLGDSISEIQMYLNAGIDAFFNDSVSDGRKAIDSRNISHKL